MKREYRIIGVGVGYVSNTCYLSHEGGQSRRTKQKECINDKLGNNSSPCNFKEKKLKTPHWRIRKWQRKSCQTGKIRQINKNIKTLYIHQQDRDISDYHVNIFFH